MAVFVKIDGDGRRSMCSQVCILYKRYVRRARVYTDYYSNDINLESTVMESVALCGLYLFLKKKRHGHMLERRRRLRARRRRAFARRQSRERVMFAFLLSMVLASQSPVRSVWMKPRSSSWWEEIVMCTFTASDWLENFRMSHATFLYVCSEIRSSVEKSDTVMRNAIPVEQRVALTLWFLSTGTDYRTVAHLFGVSKSTVCLITKQVCTAIVQILLQKYVRFPSQNCLKDVVDGFQHKWGFPQCAGVVDGTHIPIVSPQAYPADYFNRKGWHSIIMQGTVNHLGVFVDVYIGWPGRVHDARVFANSTLYQRGQEKSLLPHWTEHIGGEDVPLVILGDPAYPLLPWLMKSFPDNGRLSRQQKLFNYRLSRARVVVEHAYGRLKGRWRCLLKRLDVSVEDVPSVIATCCVLHNICEMHGDTFDESLLEGVETDDGTSAADSGPPHSVSGANVRQALMAFFQQQSP